MEAERPRANHGDHSLTIVQTLLLPRRTFPWAIQATFVPGNTNLPLGSEIDETHYERKFASLKNLVKVLVDQGFSDQIGQNSTNYLTTTDWLYTVQSDEELFLDSNIVVHNSPPQWLDLSKLGSSSVDAGAITTVMITSPDVAHGAAIMLAYGGSRIFLTLIRNVNLVQTKFFERVGARIQSGDFDFKK